MSMSGVVDLRSDTLTRPSPGMRDAMARAEVGDDVYGEDPTVRRLEEVAAERLGHEAAIFVPTGTMGNQVAINLQTTPGSDVLVEQGTHVYCYELGAMTAWSGVVPRVLVGEAGRLRPEQIEGAVAPQIYYMSPTVLLVLENSHNNAGGTVLTAELQDALIERAHGHGLKVHLDGARIFNAATCLDLPVARLSEKCDTVMFCLSKGLGAPVGSMLCGGADAIREARVVRKRMGGGLRQVGVLAAAGLYALEHNVARISDDHARARRLAEALAQQPAFKIDPETVQTNILVATVDDPSRTDEVLGRLRSEGLLAGAMGRGRIRFVTHLDVDDADVERAVEIIGRLDLS
jgi:threonine aldolase